MQLKMLSIFFFSLGLLFCCAIYFLCRVHASVRLWSSYCLNKLWADLFGFVSNRFALSVLRLAFCVRLNKNLVVQCSNKKNKYQIEYLFVFFLINRWIKYDQRFIKKIKKKNRNSNETIKRKSKWPTNLFKSFIIVQTVLWVISILKKTNEWCFLSVILNHNYNYVRFSVLNIKQAVRVDGM